MVLSFADARFNMVECQLRPCSVIDPLVLEAFRTTPRESYVPDALKGVCYADGDLNLGHGRALLDAAAHARLLQAIELSPDMRVLDIGCLQGYSTAILSHIVKRVTGIDQDTWIKHAQKHAAKNAQFVAASMIHGVPENGPYDAIIINGAIEMLPDALIRQIRKDGVIAAFRRTTPTSGHAVLFRRHGDHVTEQVLFDFVAPVVPGFEKAEAFVF